MLGNKGDMKQVVYVATVTFWLGIAVLVAVVLFLSRKTPPVVPKEDIAASKPLYRSFMGRVTAVGDSITLLPQGAGLPVRLIARHNVRFLRLDEGRGKLTPGVIEDLAPDDVVFVDVREIEGNAGVLELRTVIVIPESQ